MASSNVQLPNPSSHLPAKLWFNESRTNYQMWKTSALYLIQRQGLIGLIDGSYSPSSGLTVTNPEYDVWRRTDELLKQGILSLLDEDVVKVVKHLNTSREVWLKLETMFRDKQYHKGSAVQGQHIITVRDWKEYYPSLHKAALKGDWDTAKVIMDKETDAISAKLNSTEGTALHIAVGSGEGAIMFVENLVARLSHIAVELIATKDVVGDTALSTAAAVGNKEAATIIATEHPDSVYIPNNLGEFPIHTAAKHAKRDTLGYLISVTDDNRVDQNPYAGLSGLTLLIFTINAGFLDIALDLVRKYSYLARLKLSSHSALKSIVENTAHVLPSEELSILAYKMSAFRDWMYPHREDSGSVRGEFAIGVEILLDVVFSSRGTSSGGTVNSMRPLVVKIVELLCEHMKSMRATEAEDIYRDAILIAAKLGNRELVEQIVEAFPDAIYCSNPASFQTIFHVAVENRVVDVYNLIYDMRKHKHLKLDLPDINGNNLLHLAAKLAPPSRLAELPNAAFQMQHELKWYKEVEKIVHPHCGEQLNNAGKSPWMIFIEEHQNLRKEGENWVKSVATSYTITAALICTIMFAAAITVPGGFNSSTGLPFFGKDTVFTFFAVSDVISLLLSATSLIVFKDIFTLGYAEKDFSKDIPIRLKIGLNTLNLSINFMMLTFSATIYIVFGRNHKWVLAVVVIVAFYIGGLSYIFQNFFLVKLENPTKRFGTREDLLRARKSRVITLNYMFNMLKTHKSKE